MNAPMVQPMPDGDPFAHLSDAERRLVMRAPVDILADLRRVGRTPFRVHLADLSRTGCRAETVIKTLAGDRIWLTIPGFSALEAIIRWSNPRGFGAQWVSALHPSVFEHICKLYPALSLPTDRAPGEDHRFD